MATRVSLGVCLLLALVGCDEEEGGSGERGSQGEEGGDEGASDGDSLRNKLDAYLRQAGLEDSVDCLCDGDPAEHCEDLDLTSESARDCYVEEARAHEAATIAFFDCAIPIMQRYVACMEALDSCEEEGREACEGDYAEMLSCPAPPRSVRDAWRACDEEL